MKVWEEFLEHLDLKLGKQTVDFWLRTLTPYKQEDATLYLRAVDSFQVGWFEEHVRPLAPAYLVDAQGQKWQLLVQAGPEAGKRAQEPQRRKKQTAKSAYTFGTAPPIRCNALDPSSSFESLASHPGNVLAIRALQQVIQNPALCASQGYIPIYLHGPAASGKTHLLMAAANSLQATGKKALYVTGETFTEHVVQALRLGNMQQFRHFYRGADALFVDGVEVLSHKAATQEEFFHTFNSLHVAAKTIVVSAPCAPKDLKGVEERLISRFEWGLLIQLESPPREQMEAILDLHSKRLGLKLHPEQQKVLLHHFARDASALVAALSALGLRCHRQQLSLTTLSGKKVLELLADLIVQAQTQTITAAQIVELVSHFYGITTQDILGKGQQREFCLPRQIAMFLCREKLQMPFTHIARLFGRDHSTVMTSCKNIDKQSLEGRSRLGSDLPLLRQKLSAPLPPS